MYSISHKDFSCILNLLDSINKINEYTNPFSNADDFYNDSVSFDATLMNFIVIGEMVDKLSVSFKDETETLIDWQKIVGFRNIIAHNYFGIDAEEVWQIIHGSLAILKNELEKITS
jgi:uncharacterized protein with HEPN domain